MNPIRLEPGTGMAKCLGILLAFLILTSCSFTHPFRIKNRNDLEGLNLIKIKPVYQKKRGTCGLACLSMVLTYWGNPVTITELHNDLTERHKRGITPLQMKALAEQHGCFATLFEGTLDDVLEQITKGRPVIVVKKTFPAGKHFEVVCGFNSKKHIIICHNPLQGLYYLSYEKFKKRLTKTHNFICIIGLENDKSSKS